MMDTRSEVQLATVDPKLAELVRIAAAELEAEGTFLCVVSGLRTAAEQQALFAQGRSQAGHVVTNAQAGQSMHNYGLAVDVVPYLSGDGGALNWKADTQQFKVMVAAFEKQGLIWGGAWESIKDYDHFQMSGLPVSPNTAMRALYGDGSPAHLQNIWAAAHGGQFKA